MIHAQHLRVFPAHLSALPHEFGNVRITGRDLPLGIGVDNRSKRWRLRQHLRAKGSGRYITDKSLTEVLPVAFVGGKEKRLILLDGSAKRPSELIQVERRPVRLI